MPFGLCNAGATFQRLMDLLMAGLHMEVCLVYLDDVIVYASTPEEHLGRIVAVLSRFRQAGLNLNQRSAVSSSSLLRSWVTLCRQKV